MESFKVYNGKEKLEKIDEMANAEDVPFSELEDEAQDTTIEELHNLIDYLDEMDYDNIADIILDYLDIHYEPEADLTDDEFYEGEELAEDEMEDDSEEDEDGEELDEKMATKFTGKKKGKRKFKLTKAKLRQGKKKNKAALRKGRVKGRIARKKNKIKIKKYQASRNKAIKKGQHTSKIHRGR